MTEQPYTTRQGGATLPASSADPYSFASVEAPDDGVIIVAAGHAPTCVDCGRGTLRWAEAGHVPWHRICDVCGAHWDLHPVTYFGKEVGEAEPEHLPPSQRPQRFEWMGTGVDGRLRPLAQLDPDPRLPGTTHAELLRLAIEAGAVHPNGPRSDEHIASACWAQRARFYARR